MKINGVLKEYDASLIVKPDPYYLKRTGLGVANVAFIGVGAGLAAVMLPLAVVAIIPAGIYAAIKENSS